MQTSVEIINIVLSRLRNHLNIFKIIIYFAISRFLYNIFKYMYFKISILFLSPSKKSTESLLAVTN